jgi:hypothetical protein
MNALTLQNLLDWNLAEERNLTSDLAESTDYSNAIPVYELTALSQDLDDLVVSQDATVFRLQNSRVVNCSPNQTLQFAEYQIARSVCTGSMPGEIPPPNDKLRVQMYNRIHSIISTRTSDPEIIECYNTNDPQDKYSAISQKQALLLMLHYLKYVIHSTKDSKFGMLTYDELVEQARTGQIATLQIAVQHDTVIATDRVGHRFACMMRDEELPLLILDATGEDGSMPFEVLPMDEVRETHLHATSRRRTCTASAIASPRASDQRRFVILPCAESCKGA